MGTQLPFTSNVCDAFLGSPSWRTGGEWRLKISNRRTSNGYTLQRWTSENGIRSFSAASSNVPEVFPFIYAPMIGHETKCTKHAAHDRVQTHGCVHFMCVTRCVIYPHNLMHCRHEIRAYEKWNTHKRPPGHKKQRKYCDVCEQVIRVTNECCIMTPEGSSMPIFFCPKALLLELKPVIYEPVS